MDLTLIPSVANLAATTCVLGLMVIAVCIVFVALARFIASTDWWPFR